MIIRNISLGVLFVIACIGCSAFTVSDRPKQLAQSNRLKIDKDKQSKNSAELRQSIIPQENNKSKSMNSNMAHTYMSPNETVTSCNWSDIELPRHVAYLGRRAYLHHQIEKFPSEKYMIECAIALFIAADGNGSERMPAVVGAMPSQFLTMRDQTYMINSIELVATPKDLPAYAYSSYSTDHKEIAERPLTAFEKTAIKKAKKGQFIASETQEAFGAIRAREDCLRCHPSREKGEMLGGLSFKLSRVK